jgi:hypothetical protein
MFFGKILMRSIKYISEKVWLLKIKSFCCAKTQNTFLFNFWCSNLTFGVRWTHFWVRQNRRPSGLLNQLDCILGCCDFFFIDWRLVSRNQIKSLIYISWLYIEQETSLKIYYIWIFLFSILIAITPWCNTTKICLTKFSLKQQTGLHIFFFTIRAHKKIVIWLSL